jgi:CheY-like chemotaxis protein
MKKILLVDDNTDLTYITKKRLEQMDNNLKIISVHSGEECLKLLKEEEKPDLILLDIMMPEMDGWDTFAKIQKEPEWASIPIIFLTAKTDGYSKGFGKFTAADYIEKPLKIEELKKIIDSILKVSE